MITLKKYGILAGKYIGLVLIETIILSILNYLFVPTKIIHIIGLIFLILISLILSFKEARNSRSRGIVTGLKIGLFLISLLFFINLLFYQSSFKFVRIIYYIILLFSSILGAIIGINTKTE